MESLPDLSHSPRVGSHPIPDDIIIYILGFLESTTLAAMTLASRHLHEVVTPTLYSKITIPKKGEEDIEHQKSAARLLRTLWRTPSLAGLVRHLENAPLLIPLEVLESINSESEHSYPSDLQAKSAEKNTQVHSLHPIPEDVMRSCVNLQSLTVTGILPFAGIKKTGGWLSFLLDPSIKLRSLRLFVYAQDPLSWAGWNCFVVEILDIQTSLECMDSPGFSLEHPFNIIRPSLLEDRAKRWAPKLRVLGGSYVSLFKALLSKTRPIETVMVYSVSMKNILRFFGTELNAVETIKEFIYGGPSGDSIDFAELFHTMPSLRIFRGEAWLRDPLCDPDIFTQDLPQAFVLTPHLTEFDFRDNNRHQARVIPVFQRNLLNLDGPPPFEQEFPDDQASLLARYSAICPSIRVFAFPDGRKWVRTNGRWTLRARFARNYD